MAEYYGIEWLNERIDELGWHIDDDFMESPANRFALLWHTGYVATRAIDNPALSKQSELMLKRVLGDDLESRLLLTNEQDEEMRCLLHDCSLNDPEHLNGVISIKTYQEHESLVSPPLTMDGSHYLFPLVGKRSLTAILDFPKNDNVVVGALYLTRPHDLTIHEIHFVTDYCLDIGPKMHLKHQREALRKLYEFRNDMIQDASHNLLGMATAAAAKAKTIYRGVHGSVPEYLKQPMEMLAATAQLLETNMQRYLRSAQEGKIIFTPKRTDLKRDIVDVIIGRYSDRLSSKGVVFWERYDTSFWQDTVTFELDPVWISGAIENLMKNIIDHAPPKCRMACGYSQDDEYGVLHVWNSGPHIDHHKALYAGDVHTKDDGSLGYSVGLPYVKMVAEQHGGRFEIKNTWSETEGPGTDMQIWIPKNMRKD
jgi:signal transduction histidine kinase